MKISKAALVASLAAVAGDTAEAQPANPDKWNGPDQLTDFTYDFVASPNFAVSVAPTVGSGLHVSFSGPGTLSSPQVSPPRGGWVSVNWYAAGLLEALT